MNWILTASTIVLAGLALGTLYKWVVRPFYVFAIKFIQFLDDWNGEAARPGIAPERLGVMARLSKLEASSARVEQSSARVEYEVKPNGGASMKDQIDRIEAHVVPEENRPTPP